MDKPTIGEALRSGSLSQCQEELLAHLEAAVQDVFTTMLATMCELVGSRTSTAASTARAEAHALDAIADTFGPQDVAVEAVVEFTGPARGAVLLRCTHAGASDITRGLLMLDAGAVVELAEIRDALGECANMVTGALKTRALDPHGEFRLSVPRIDTCVDPAEARHLGSLVYKLAQGCAAIEIWLEESAGAPAP